MECFPTPNFWHERWCCSHWPLPVYCTLLLFATFIDTRGLEQFLLSLGTFLGKSFQPNFLTPALALQSVTFRWSSWQTKICFILPEFLLNQILLTNIFFDQDFLPNFLLKKIGLPFLQTYHTNTTKPNLPNQTKPTEPNIPNQTYQTNRTKRIKPNVPNQTYQIKCTKPNLHF